jgi:hypothetical protein
MEHASQPTLGLDPTTPPCRLAAVSREELIAAGA